MHKRRFKILLTILLTPIVLFCLFLLFERIRGQISLASYKRELIAKGEKLTFKELIPPVREGENGAPAIADAIERLQRGRVLPDNVPPMMRLTPTGRAIIGFREQEWIYDKVTNSWDGLTADLRTNEAVLTEICAALARPVLNNNLDYSQAFNMRFGHLAPHKQLSFWFGAAAGLALREGNNHHALGHLIAQARLPRLSVEDCIVISELVRIAIASIAKNSTWEALQADGWTDEDLARLQEAWARESFVTSMAKCLEGERAFGLASSEEMRGSNQATYDALYWQETLSPFLTDDQKHQGSHAMLSNLPDSVRIFTKRQIYCRLWRFGWSHQDEQRYLEGMQLLLEIARGAIEEKSLQKIIPLLDEFAETAPTKTFYDRLRFPSSSQSLAAMAKVINRAMRADTERSLTISAIALKRYTLRHGKSPASLDALIPEFLSFVPVDYMNGAPLKYRLNTDGSFTLYSVGEDGKDDGGDASLLPDKMSYRNLWDRKDFVWPAPATAEEVEAYRTEAAKD